jgi:hypothetical protein
VATRRTSPAPSFIPGAPRAAAAPSEAQALPTLLLSLLLLLLLLRPVLFQKRRTPAQGRRSRNHARPQPEQVVSA